MNWIPIRETSQLDELREKSFDLPVLIFKHSTSCSISGATLDRLERKWENQNGIFPYFLDLKANRSISNEIEERFGVVHESPQVIIIKDGKAVYNESHMGINYDRMMAALTQVTG